MTSTPHLPRASWTSTPPAAPGRLVDPAGLAVHWIGQAVPPPVNRAERAAVARFLEAVRRYHGRPGVLSASGGSDIAYQEAVDQAGRRWRLRGWALRSAANGDTGPNARWGAVVALIGQGQEPTDRMLQGLADARADFRRVHPTGTRLATHNQVRPAPTACPGPDLTRWVNRGGPRPSDPTPPNPPGEDDMTTEELLKELRDPDSALARALRNNVRIAVQEELKDERQGRNPGQGR